MPPKARRPVIAACAAALLACATAGLAADGARDRGENSPVTAPYTAEPVTVDGALDEAVWADATPMLVRYATAKKEDDLAPEKTVMTVYYAWDDFYFYIGYRWHDANLTALPSERIEGPMTNKRQGAVVWNDAVPVDLAEFFIAPISEQHYWELHHNPMNYWNDIAITVLPEKDPMRNSDAGRWGILFHDGDYVEDDGQYTFASAVQMMLKDGADPDAKRPDLSTVNNAADTDTGYTAEIRVPWRSIGPWDRRAKDVDRTRLPMPWDVSGLTFRSLIVAQNPDLPGRGYYHSSPAFPGGWFHHGVPHWNPIVMGDKPKADDKK